MLDFFNRIGEIIDKIIEFVTTTAQSITNGVDTLSNFWGQISSFFTAFPFLTATLSTLLGLLLTWIILSIFRDFV